MCRLTQVWMSWVESAVKLLSIWYLPNIQENEKKRPHAVINVRLDLICSVGGMLRKWLYTVNPHFSRPPVAALSTWDEGWILKSLKQIRLFSLGRGAGVVLLSVTATLASQVRLGACVCERRLIALSFQCVPLQEQRFEKIQWVGVMNSGRITWLVVVLW